MLRTRCLISLALFLSFGAWRPPFCASAGKPTAASILNGTVRASTAESIAGVTVSAAAEGGTITTSVYTDEQGRYYFPSMPGGKYRVWAQAVGYQAGRARVELNPAGKTRQDFTLPAAKDFERQLTSPEWLSALPDRRPEDIRLKLIFVHSCTTCHSAAFALQNKFDEAGWKAILVRMERYQRIRSRRSFAENLKRKWRSYHPRS